MKKFISLFLAIVLVLSAVPFISADELGQGSFEVSATLDGGKGSVFVRLKPPAESITVSGVELDVILPEGFSFNDQPTATFGGWQIIVGSAYASNGCNGRKIAVYTTTNPQKTVKNSVITLIEIPVTYPANLKPGNKDVTINVTDVSIDLSGKSVSGLDYFEAVEEAGNREYTYQKSFKYEKNITDAKITGIVNKPYTGGKIKQSPKIELDGNTLIENTDYVLNYSSNTDCGVATVTILGKGGYKGQVKKTFYIIPASVYDISTANPTTDRVTVSWSKAKKVSGYYILRSTSKTEGFEIVKTINDGEASSYVDEGLLSGNKYYYKVQAFILIDGKEVPGNLTTAAPSSTLDGYKINATDGLAVSQRTSTSITLKWKKTEVANNVANKTVSGYYVYRSTSKSSGYKKIATISDGNTLTYKDKKLKVGKTYYYKIRPYRTYKSNPGVGPYSSVLTAKTLGKVGTVAGLKTSSKTVSSISLKWSSVATASGYQIYRSAKKSSGYSLLATVTKTKYTHKSLYSGTTGYYKVRAYRLEDGKKVYGSYSKVLTAKTAGYKVSKPTGLKVASKSSSKISIKWKKVSKANGYFIYRSTSKSSGYKKIATLTSGKKVSYTDKKVKSKKTYYYKVVAYRTYKKAKGVGKHAILKVKR